MPIPAPVPSFTASSGPAVSESESAGATIGGFSDEGHVFNFNGGSSSDKTTKYILGGIAAFLGVLWIIKK